MSDSDIKLQPFNYKTLTFMEWMNAINSHELFADKPEWVKVLLAARADILASYIDARANNNMFHSMYTKQAVYDFARYLDYTPSTPSCAAGEIQVTLLPSVTLPHTISKADLVFQTQVAVGGNPVRFSALADHTFNSLVENIPVMEGAQYSDTLPAVLAGSEFEEVIVPRESMVIGSASMTINGEIWEEVEHFFDSGNLDRHFRVLYLHDKTVKVRGGNGVYGQKFPAGFEAVLTAWYGGGTRGNLAAGKISVYTGQDAYVKEVTNPARTSGGAGEESIDRIKTLAPLLVAAQDRCVSSDDFWAMSMKYPGVARAFVQPNYYGLLSVRVQIVPNGGGAASESLKSNLTDHLKSKTLLSSIFVQVDTADYQPVDVIIEILPEEGYTYAEVLPYAQLAARLAVGECTAELKEALLSEGIANTVDYINSLWSFSFDSSDDVVCRIIKNMISKSEVRAWSKDIFSNEFYSLTDQVDGIDEIIVVVPVNIQAIDLNKISSAGSLSFMEADKPERTVNDGITVGSSVSAGVLFAPSSSSGVALHTSCFCEVE